MKNKASYLLAAFILIAVVWSANARAETNVFVGAWSTHLVTNEDYTETHDLVAIEHKNWIAGRFVNSYSRNTVFAGRKLAWKYESFEAGVYGGVMRGYRSCYGDEGRSAKVCPMISPYVTWDLGPVNPQVFLLGEALAISVRISL